MKGMARMGMLACLFLLAACSSFERDWREAAATGTDDRFSGRWQGRWSSSKHRNSGGELRCILKRSGPAASGQRDALLYQAHFKARWLLFSSSYKVPLTARLRGETLSFSGAHALPAVYGGLYRFEGSATPRHFSSSYHSSYDEGRFEMDRLR